MKRVKNNTGSSQTWVGQMISAGVYYTLEAFEEPRWAKNVTFLAAVMAGEAIVATADADVVGISEQIDFLKDVVRVNSPDYTQTKYTTVAANTVDTDGLVVIPNGVVVGIFEFRGDSVGPENYVVLVFDYGGASEKILAVARGSEFISLDPTLAENQVTGNGVKTLGIVVVNDSIASIPAVGGSFKATTM